MSRQAALRFISNGCIRRSLCFALSSLTAFSCSLITVGHVQADVDASASARLLARPASTQPSAQEVTALEASKPIERELAGGQEHSYDIRLAEGQYASLIVEQRGLDVVVQLLAVTGKIRLSFDGEYRSQGEEKVEMVAEAAGSYRLSVKASSKSAPTGQYEIRVAELRAATKNDRLMHEARKLEADGGRAFSAGKYQDARQFAEQALTISENVLGTEHPFVARLVFQLAYYYFSLVSQR